MGQLAKKRKMTPLSHLLCVRHFIRVTLFLISALQGGDYSHMTCEKTMANSETSSNFLQRTQLVSDQAKIQIAVCLTPRLPDKTCQGTIQSSPWSLRATFIEATFPAQLLGVLAEKGLMPPPPSLFPNFQGPN